MNVKAIRHLMKLLVLAAVVMILLVSTPSFADSIGGVDFGSAGMSNWSLLAIGGTPSIANWQFGTVATTVQQSGGCGPGLGPSGCGGPNGNVGISGPTSGTGSSFSTDAQSMPVGTYTGTVYLTTNSTEKGVPAAIPVVTKSTKPSQAAADANLGVLAALALTPNVSGPGSCAVSNLSGSCTIAAAVNGGQNVIDLSGIKLNSGASLTFGGDASTTWVVIVSGDVSLMDRH